MRRRTCRRKKKRKKNAAFPHTYASKKNHPRTQDKEGWSCRDERKGRRAKQLQPRSTQTARPHAHTTSDAPKTDHKRRQIDTQGQRARVNCQVCPGNLYTPKVNGRCTLLPAVCVFIDIYSIVAGKQRITVSIHGHALFQ